MMALAFYEYHQKFDVGTKATLHCNCIKIHKTIYGSRTLRFSGLNSISLFIPTLIFRNLNLST
jgi:hypothetical protein